MGSIPHSSMSSYHGIRCKVAHICLSGQMCDWIVTYSWWVGLIVFLDTKATHNSAAQRWTTG